MGAAQRERRTVGLLFFRSDAAEAELLALLRELGGVLVRADGAFAAVFDAAPGESPAGQALLAGQAVLARDLTPCAIVDLDALLVLPRPEGARSYQSPRFTEDGSYPQADDPPGLLATARAAEVLTDVERRPARRGLVSLVTSMTGDAHVGRVLVLAGQAREAIAPLESVTRACVALTYPVAHTRAHYFLGLAREGVGDGPGACAAYAVVLRRWGAGQSPASVTAALTRARVAALHCPVP